MGERMNVLHNAKVSVEFSPERKQISGHDLTDRNNEPAFYSKSKRGIIKAWADIEKLFAVFPETTTMHDILVVLQSYNIQTHSYCAVD
jgi:hypothetical protein